MTSKNTRLFSSFTCLTVLIFVSGCADLKLAKHAYHDQDYTTAFNHWSELAKRDFPDAWYGLGRIYSRGLGRKPDFILGEHYLQKAEKAGITNSAYELGVLYENPRFPKYNVDTAITWYKKSISRGNTNARFRLASLYLENPSSQNMKNEGLQILTTFAEQGDIRASYKLGQLYEEGSNVIQDSNKAELWYSQAAAAGHENAALKLASLYIANNKTNEALSIYKRLAHNNNATAMYRLGRYYETNTNETKTNIEAVRWYQKAIVNGDTNSNIRLAYLALQQKSNEYGLDKQVAITELELLARNNDSHAATTLGKYYQYLGDSPSLKKARSWYLIAIELGDHQASYRLAKMFETGAGGSVNISKAIKYYKFAAQSGNHYADYQLGKLHSLHNRSEAIRWFRKAAKKGFRNAEMRLVELLLSEPSTSEDKTEAIKWLKRASNRGNPKAMYKLGSAYVNGIGTQKNYEQGLIQYLAAARGNVTGAVQAALQLMDTLDTETITRAEQASKKLKVRSEI